MHPIIDAAWFEITALIISIVLGIGLVLFLEMLPKKSRIKNRTEEFIKLKNWDTRKDGVR